MDIKDTLKARQKQHGDFNSHCSIERSLRDILDKNSAKLDDVMYIGASMVIHKLARILNSGATHADTWHDIAGYAVLVERHVSEINAFEIQRQMEIDEINNER